MCLAEMIFLVFKEPVEPLESLELLEEMVTWALLVEMAGMVSTVLEEQVEETEGMVTSLQLLLFHHYIPHLQLHKQDSLE